MRYIIAIIRPGRCHDDDEEVWAVICSRSELPFIIDSVFSDARWKRDEMFIRIDEEDEARQLRIANGMEQ